MMAMLISALAVTVISCAALAYPASAAGTRDEATEGGGQTLNELGSDEAGQPTRALPPRQQGPRTITGYHVETDMDGTTHITLTLRTGGGTLSLNDLDPRQALLFLNLLRSSGPRILAIWNPETNRLMWRLRAPAAEGATPPAPAQGQQATDAGMAHECTEDVPCYVALVQSSGTVKVAFSTTGDLAGSEVKLYESAGPQVAVPLRELDYDRYRGQAILVRGQNIQGDLWGAEVVDVGSSLLTELIKHIALSQP